MIETLRIEHLAIVERAELEFGPGLNVLTGETGAGKSIVLGALGLLVGGRASSDAIAEGAGEGAVEAVFRIDCHPDVQAELMRRDFVEASEPELIVRRSVSRAGRSRARLGGQLVPISTLAEVFEGRVEISSQHSSQALLRVESHGRLLDAAGRLESAREVVESGYAALRALDAELASLREDAAERERRRDFLGFQVGEIDDAELESGELGELEHEHGRLAHAERIRGEGGVALAELTGDPSTESAAAAADAIGSAGRRLDGLASVAPDFEPLAARLRALDAEVRELARDLERQLDGVAEDPARLAAVEERLATIERLRRKYGDDVDAILETRARLAEELDGVAGADEREAELAAERSRAEGALAAAAKELTEGRARAAQQLAVDVGAGLKELAMPAARFEVALEAAEVPAGFPCGPHGSELPEFRFAADKGAALRPLRKVASGGELSRVFLALKNALRRTGIGMVLVFDEVDAGIGGRTAERVGRALAELAAHHQVLCITHLPQIAALAETHFRVDKAERGGRARTRVARIEGADRVDEIARMAGGEKITAATRRHARELLGDRVSV